jgi:hypothetical protein
LKLIALPDLVFTDFDRFGVPRTSTGSLLRFNCEAMVLSESLCGFCVDFVWSLIRTFFSLSVNKAGSRIFLTETF